MMTYGTTSQRVISLLAEEPVLGPERLPTAAGDYRRLAPAILREVASLSHSPEQSLVHNREFRTALLRLASIECAAGAAIERCQSWFDCLASLASWTSPGTSGWIDAGEAAIWTALALRLEITNFSVWPEDPGTESTSDRVVYRLLTQKPLVTRSDRRLFENGLWEDLCSAVEDGHSVAAGRCFRSIADWWLAEYRDTETPTYDPEHFSTFEPAPNAALAIALISRRLEIHFDRTEHQRFYYVALMLREAHPKSTGLRSRKAEG